jgi:bacterioferritin
MAKQKLIAALKEALAFELGTILQYMWHHAMTEGKQSPAVCTLFKEISIAEMRHAEALAKRIVCLGGTLVTTSAEINMGGNLTKMIQDDLACERRAIKQYKAHLKLCDEANDPMTRRILENILEREEEHDAQWSSILTKSLDTFGY